jgi:hypothetical protein
VNVAEFSGGGIQLALAKVFPNQSAILTFNGRTLIIPAEASLDCPDGTTVRVVDYSNAISACVTPTDLSKVAYYNHTNQFRNACLPAFPSQYQ